MTTYIADTEHYSEVVSLICKTNQFCKHDKIEYIERKILLSDTFAGVYADELDSMEIVLAKEETFDIKLADDITATLLSVDYTIQKFCNLVKDKIQ